MPFDTLSLEPATTTDRVTEELRRAMFAGELDPGTPLREVALAESLQVSRSTVREALAGLVAEGLVDRVPHKGTVVRALDADASSDVCRARLALESAGVRAWPEAAEDARSAVRAALEAFAALVRGPEDPTAPRSAPGIPELTARHLAIHRALVALTGSPRLLAAADSLYAEIRLALANVDRIRRNAEEQVCSHTALVELLESGDTEATLAELDEHLAGARTSMLATVANASLPDPGPEGH
ncbi:MAG: GntR family transcriptional regulator [Marmoricola sp.]